MESSRTKQNCYARRWVAMARNRNVRDVQPRSGERVQPTTQAVGEKYGRSASSEGAKEGAPGSGGRPTQSAAASNEETLALGFCKNAVRSTSNDSRFAPSS